MTDSLRQPSRVLHDGSDMKDSPQPADLGMLAPSHALAGIPELSPNWLDISLDHNVSSFASDQPWIPRDILTPGSYTLNSGPTGISGGAGLPGACGFSFPYGPYREIARSECDTSSCGILPSDSGYGSYGAKRSVATYSIHDDLSEPAETLDIAGGLRNFSFEVEGSWAQPQDQPQWRCDRCSKTLKTHSELKKHQQRHTKSFTCNVLGCEWKDGFSTQNDLDRHKRSKHPSECADGIKYKCPAPDCKDRQKTWPRLDNFRAHVRRLHPEERVDDWEKCIYRPLESPTSQDIYHTMSEITSPQAFNPYQFSSSGESACSPSPFSPGLSQLATIEPPYESCFFGDFPPAGDYSSSMEVSEDSTDSADASALSLSITEEMLLDDDDDMSPPQSVTLSPDDGAPVLPQHDGQHCVEGSMQRTRLVLHPDDPVEMEKIMKELDPVEIEKISAVVERLKGQYKTKDAQILGSENVAGSRPDEQNDCSVCQKLFPRPSELKKHMKRHVKPYGCTIPGCLKKFGSKNDWKRHENSQHFLLEVWKCQEECGDKPSKVCGKINHRRETFKTHLEKSHNLSGSVVDEKLESCREGSTCDARFWCGFCEAFVEIKQKDFGAWKERFDHIDDHYAGRGGWAKKHIDEWKYMDAEAESSGLGLEFSRSDGSDEEQPTAASSSSGRPSPPGDKKEDFVDRRGEKRKAEDSEDEGCRIKRSFIKRNPKSGRKDHAFRCGENDPVRTG